MDRLWSQVGALLNGESCLFRVWCPLKKKVSLLLNGKEYEMQAGEHGYWSVEVEAVAHGDRYRFKMDDGEWLPDPASRWQPEGVEGDSAVVTGAFSWTDTHWKGIPAQELIIYELHVGTFSAAGDFDGVIEKLGYLSELGITAIELMPVAAFPGDRNWGYDGVFPFAAHAAYGGPNGLKKLVDTAHEYGIAVILDVVYNHFGPEGNYFEEYGPYFTDKYKSTWAKAINFDDAWCDGVRSFFLQNAVQWLEEFHMDGLRLDAVHAINDNSARHFMDELREHAEAVQERTGKKKLLIAELDLNDPKYVRSPRSGGYGLHAQWIDEYHHALHALVTGERNGYYEDFGSPHYFFKAIRDAYVYTGEYSVHRKKRFGVYPHGTTFDQFIVFAQNHDQVGNRPHGDRLSASLPFEARKLVAATVLLSPYIPLLFMGEEYGETNPFLFFTSHSDPALKEAVKKGRYEEFAHFFGDEEVPDPQAEDTFRRCKLNWQAAAEEENARLLRFYRRLLAFRKSHPVFKGKDRELLEMLETGNDHIIGFRRHYNGEALLVFFNFSTSGLVCNYILPAGSVLLLDGTSEGLPGDEAPPPVATGSERLVVPALSVVVFEHKGSI